MKPVEVEFLRRLVTDRPPRRPLGVASAMLLDKEAIGRLSGQSIFYSDRDFERAKNLLDSRGFSVQTPAPNQSRSNTVGNGSEKTGARAVKADLVAVVPMNMPDSLQAPAGGFLVMDWRKAVQLPYEALLVVENLDPLLQILDYRWLNEYVRGRPTLALYRGDVSFSLSASLQVILDKLQQRPTLAFFDFDPKGLEMAATLPRREALCLPDWRMLELATRGADQTALFAQSYPGSSAFLDKHADPEIAIAWKRMKTLNRGLPQEGFPK